MFQPQSLRQTAAEEIVLRAWNARSSRIIEEKDVVTNGNNCKTIFLQGQVLSPIWDKSTRKH